MFLNFLYKSSFLNKIAILLRKCVRWHSLAERKILKNTMFLLIFKLTSVKMFKNSMLFNDFEKWRNRLTHGFQNSLKYLSKITVFTCTSIVFVRMSLAKQRFWASGSQLLKHVSSEIDVLKRKNMFFHIKLLLLRRHAHLTGSSNRQYIIRHTYV